VSVEHRDLSFITVLVEYALNVVSKTPERADDRSILLRLESRLVFFERRFVFE